MATLIPSSNVEAAYEDMFKEITRKLYGEETGNGLHTLGTPVAQVATSGPTAPEGERSFTNLQQIDSSTAPTIEYEQRHSAGTGGAAAAAAATQNASVVIQQQPEGSVVVATTGGGGSFKSEDHLSTAFGLAALMQNGFATTGTILSTQAINKVVTNAAGQQQPQSSNITVAVAADPQQRWSAGGGGDVTTTVVADQQQQPQIVQWTTGGKLQSYTTTQQQQQQQQQQIAAPKSKSKNRNDLSATVNTTTEVIYTSPSTSGNSAPNSTQQTTLTSTNAVTPSNPTGSGGGGGGSRKKSHSNNNNQQNGNNTNNTNSGVQIQKRYACTHCPYSTDRRDLYTRHENIHKDEKPFQCYACLKQFNRADHVKKHFLRMHREMQYDINKTRRHVPATGNHHSGGRGNITITALHTNASTSSSGGSPEQKPNIFHAANVQLDNAFLDGQRQPTSSSLSIAETIEAVATAADAPLPQLKQEKVDPEGNSGVVMGGGTVKPKREKRFTCCYCPWSGADKWGLKRHLNTHTKPFVCLLCDYKAARSERLATHVLKVHNKRACNKCSFLADTQEEFQAHLNEVHPHDNRPSRNSNNSNNSNNNATNNINVLRTIGNTLVTNNQLNTFQNTSTTFGVGQTNTATSNAGGSVTIYTTTTTNDNGAGNLATGGPLQEIIVNPTSMVGWRLSANGSLIPPHDLLTGGLPNAAAQKRGSERLFQYLEADGSDPEDYARLLKMDAISRNTASVAQDFHKAGGVHELKIPANHQLLFNNKLPTQWTTKEAAALLHSLSKVNNLSFAYPEHQQHQEHHQRMKYNGNYYQQMNGGTMRQRQHSTGDDENTPSSASSTTSSDDGVSPFKLQRHDRKQRVAATMEQRKAMSAFLSDNFELQEASSNSKRQQVVKIEDQENQEQLIKSPPAYNKYTTNYHYNNNQTKAKRNNAGNTNATNNNREHRLDLNNRDNKENTNATTFLTSMEYQNLNKIGTQFQNYVKDIINKFYAETPLMFPAMPTATTTAQQSQQREQQQSPKRKRMLSETEEYIEYLKNKEDITLTITPKITTTTPNITNYNNSNKQISPLKRQLQQDLSTLKRHSPKKVTPPQQQVSSHNHRPRKSLSHLATLLPLLADAASQQEYLTTPLDFSKKAAAAPTLDKKMQPTTTTINISFTPVAPATTTAPTPTPPHLPPPAPKSFRTTTPTNDKRSSRKQAQPKKIRAPPEVVVAMLRDKYLTRMVDRKLSCTICTKLQQTTMLVFNYHTKGSLALHRRWKHRQQQQTCKHCGQMFKHHYSLGVHYRRLHRRGTTRKPSIGDGKQQLAEIVERALEHEKMQQ